MCDDGAGSAAPAAGAVSRRGLLQGALALAGLAACSPARSSAPAASSPSSPSRRPRSADGLAAYVLGMHLHASASEGTGSMRSQLRQAALNGFDAAWFTEHDWRRRRLLYRPAYSFVPGESALGGVWNLDRLPDEGTPTPASGGRQVPDPTSPDDPAPVKASLALSVTSSGPDPATVGYRVHAEGTSRANFRGRIAGRTISVDLLPRTTGPDGWAQVLFTLSHHPGSGDRPTGVCSILYRLRPGLPDKAVSTEGLRAVVDLPVTAGRWQAVAFDLLGDLHRAWPDIDPRDNSLHDIAFTATSRAQAPVEVFFGHLRFAEQAGYDAVGVEQELVAAYAAREPHVLGLVGTEISLGPHLNQFGGVQAPFDYGAVAGLKDVPGRQIVPSVVDFIHAQGGLASINHPYAPGTPAEAARSIALDLLANGTATDLLEVGYGSFGALPQHLAAWDAMSRNGLFVTGNGVSDDHAGEDWAQREARFYTGAWAGGLDQRSLLGALARGRAFVGYLGSFGGSLDMTLDGSVPMGAVSVADRDSRTLRADVTGLPAGGAVQVVRGDVDYAGTADPTAGTSVVRTLGARDLRSGGEVGVDTRSDCFHRLQVVDGEGRVVAFGQPIWAFRTPPRTPVPPLRRTNG